MLAEARGSKLTRARVAAIVSALQHIPFIEVAAESAGVTSRTVRNWMLAGSQDHRSGKNSLAALLFLQVVQARARFEGNLALVIAKQAAQDWKAAAWVLSRMSPERWTEPQRLTLGDGKRFDGPAREPDENPPLREIRLLREARQRAMLESGA